MRIALLVLLLVSSVVAVASARVTPFIQLFHRTTRPTTSFAIFNLRGGDDSDDYEEESPRRRIPPLKPSQSQRGGAPQRGGPPPSRRGPAQRGSPPPSRRGPPSRRQKKQGPSALGTAANLAKKTVDMTTAAAWGTIKGSGKAAFYLVSPKHVSRDEIWGVWRLDQQVEDADTTVSCAANVEFTPRGDVIVKYGEQAFVTPFLFRERGWPQSCSIDFEARAFQGPNDEEPILVRYKGSFRRKIADSSIVKIVGTIYEVKRKGLWKGQPRKIGTFVARRRIMKRPASKEEEYDDLEEYDDEFEDDFDDDAEEEDVDEDNYDWDENE